MNVNSNEVDIDNTFNSNVAYQSAMYKDKSSNSVSDFFNNVQNDFNKYKKAKYQFKTAKLSVPADTMQRNGTSFEEIKNVIDTSTEDEKAEIIDSLKDAGLLKINPDAIDVKLSDSLKEERKQKLLESGMNESNADFSASIENDLLNRISQKTGIDIDEIYAKEAPTIRTNDYELSVDENGNRYIEDEISQENLDYYQDLAEREEYYQISQKTSKKAKEVISALKKIADGSEEETVKDLRNDLNEYGGTNDITFIFGDDKKGIKHIAQKHGTKTLLKVFDTVVDGKVLRFVPNKKTVILSKGNYEAVLSLDERGKKKTWLLSGWNTKEKSSDVSSEVSTQHTPTQIKPTFSRQDLGAELSNIINDNSNNFNPKTYYQSVNNVSLNFKSFEELQEAFKNDIEETPEDYKINNLENALKSLDITENKPKEVKTPYETIQVRARNIEHIINSESDKSRYKSINRMFATLERPNIITVNEQGKRAYFKIFKDSKEGKKQIVYVSTDKKGNFVLTTIPIKRNKKFINAINKGSIVYDSRKGVVNNSPDNNIINDNSNNFNPKTYYQSVNSDNQNVVDLTNDFDKAPTIQDVKDYINELVESGKKFATLSPEWFIDVKGGKRTTNKILNAGNYKRFYKKDKERHNKYIMSLEKILANARYLNSKDNIKKDKKPNIEKYHYFETNVRIGNKVYRIIFDTEEYKNDNKKTTSVGYAKRNLKETEVDTNSINDNSSNFKSRVYKIVFNTEEYKNEKPSSSANVLRSVKNLDEDNNSINDNSSNFKSRVYKVVFNTEEYKNEKPSSSINILKSVKNLGENPVH